MSKEQSPDSMTNGQVAFSMGLMAVTITLLSVFWAFNANAEDLCPCPKKIKTKVVTKVVTKTVYVDANAGRFPITIHHSVFAMASLACKDGLDYLQITSLKPLRWHYRCVER